jgi:5'-nucleotidase
MKSKLCALAITLVALNACSGEDNPPIAVASPTAKPSPSASPTASPSPVATVPFTVKVIGFNDYHGTLESPGSLGTTTAVASANRPPVGGADFIAAHIDKLKAQNPLNVVVGAGDLIGASPLISASFFDEPSVETLNRIGLEFSSVGNHEFDKGSVELLRLQNGGCKMTGGVKEANSCKGLSGSFDGAKFKWLSANVISGDTGKPLLPAYGIKTFNGVKMAFIGMTLKGTPSIVSPGGIATLSFKDEATTVNTLIPELRAQGIEAIAVLIHEGGFQSGTLGDINGCEGDLATYPIADVVSKLDDAVDMVISAHTHTAYNCKLPNLKGRKILVTSSSAFGRVLADIDVSINPTTSDVIAATATNRLVVRNDPTILANASVTAIVDNYRTLVSPVANVVLGAISTALPNSRSDAACNMPAGNLIADSQVAATKAAGFGDAVMGFMNGGGVRSPGFTYAPSPAGEAAGDVTYGEAFTVQPFGNVVVTISLTSKDIKDFLEEQFAGCLGQSLTATRFAVPSAGVKYTWDGSKACGARITNLTLTSSGTTETIVDATGALPNASKTYRVTVNDFMAGGGDGFTTLKKGTSRTVAGSDIEALSAFLAKYKVTPYTPSTVADDGGTPRISRVNAPAGSTTCPGGTVPNP